MTPTREQLELAAKTVGFTLLGEYEESLGIVVLSPIEGQAYWNPVTDKSDSRDLEVACEIELRYGLRGVWAIANDGRSESEVQFYSDHNNNKGLATMWAVFLCAVELGKALANGRAM